MKVMFICTGNICRSAMAHHMMKKKLKDIGRTDIEIFSCGISAQTGEKSTYAAKEVMKEYGVSLEEHQATNIQESAIQDMDLILCATNSHKRAVIEYDPHLKEKVYTMKEYAKLNENGQDYDIRDPWGYDIEIYRFCAAQIEKCIEKTIQKLTK